MGDMADIAYEQIEREQDEIGALLSLTDSELYARTAPARSPLVMSIRKYFSERGTLSTRQRFVLADWMHAHAA